MRSYRGCLGVWGPAGLESDFAELRLARNFPPISEITWSGNFHLQLNYAQNYKRPGQALGLLKGAELRIMIESNPCDITVSSLERSVQIALSFSDSASL